MKNIPIILLFWLCASCAEKDTNLLSLLPATSTFNPNTEILLGYQDARLVDIQIGEGGRVKGFTDKYFFRTDDNFETFEYAPHAFPQPYYTLTVDGDYLYHFAKDNFRFAISYSTDYGEHWQFYTLDTEDSIPFYLYTSVNISDILFENDQTMLITVETREETAVFNYYQYKSWIYRVDLSTGNKTLISTVDGYRPSAIHQHNNRLWLVLNKYTLREGTHYDLNNGYIARSDDGGVTWSEPVLIDSLGKVKLAVGSANNLFAFTPQMSAFYSTDAGNTWTVSNQADPRFLNAQFTDASTIFSGTDNVVHKSNDGGINWTPYNEIIQGTYVTGQVRFLDNNTGIVFNEGNLYLTENSGASWRLIVSKALVY